MFLLGENQHVSEKWGWDTPQNTKKYIWTHVQASSPSCMEILYYTLLNISSIPGPSKRCRNIGIFISVCMILDSSQRAQTAVDGMVRGRQRNQDSGSAGLSTDKSRRNMNRMDY